jgi:ATP-binding cassette subfamily F protein 3
LLEKVLPFDGEVQLGASLQIGYFAQAHEGLHPDLDLIQEIQLVAANMRPGEVREYLAKFLFTGDDVFKPVEVLSGGERGRLALAKLALSGANLLLLDEPTNHLDLPSQEILQAVLSDYSGTILLVSHDRYLIDALATQIWEVDQLGSILRVFEGTYSEYRVAKEAEAAARSANSQPAQEESRRAAVRAKARIGLSNAERARQRRIQELEEQIAGLEHRLAVLARQLESPPGDPGKVQQLGSEYVRVEEQLSGLFSEWETLAAKS